MKMARVLGMMIVCGAAISLYSLSSLIRTGRTQESQRKEYSNKISATYNYRFGKELPFAPGNPEIEGKDFIQPGAFPDATYCAHCHQEAYHQWRQALHSNSFREPFYRTSVNLLIKTKGIEYSRHCDSCHNPISVLSGALTQNSQVDRKFDQNGVTCTVCHSIRALRSTSGNGGYVMGVSSVMVDEKGNRIPGEEGRLLEDCLLQFSILKNVQSRKAALLKLAQSSLRTSRNNQGLPNGVIRWELRKSRSSWRRLVPVLRFSITTMHPLAPGTDGWPDIYLVNGSTYDALSGKTVPPHAALFHNNHDGTFTDVAEKAGVTNDRWGFGVAIGDYDNDGWPDIYVSNFGENRLYHNNHDDTFTDVAQKAGVTLGNWSTGASFGDYDGDGLLDLFVPGYIHWDTKRSL